MSNDNGIEVFSPNVIDIRAKLLDLFENVEHINMDNDIITSSKHEDLSVEIDGLFFVIVDNHNDKVMLIDGYAKIIESISIE